MGRDTIIESNTKEVGEDDIERAVSVILERLRPRLAETVERLYERYAGKPSVAARHTGPASQSAAAADAPPGYGALEPLIGDPSVSDIFVNGPMSVYVERRGALEKLDVGFRDHAHLMQTVVGLMRMTGKDVSRRQRLVDARLPDGSRLNVVWPPNAVDGPLVSIRRFSTAPLTDADLVKRGSIAPDMLTFLRACVKGRVNIIIAGGSGSGKTTLLNVLSAYIPLSERIVTIEDAAELRLQQPHVARLETSDVTDEGCAEVTARDLVRNALRMRPDRIIIGECRGPEALDMLVAMNTGHEGSVTTLHANTPRDALSRIETLVTLAGSELPVLTVRKQIAAAINLVIQTARAPSGARGVVAVSEITGMEGDVISMHEVFLFNETGVDRRGRPVGNFIATGIRPRCTAKFENQGIQLPRDMFIRRVLEL